MKIKDSKLNLMKRIKIEKITLNIGAGVEAENVDKAVTLLKAITGLNPVRTKGKKRIPTWKVRPGMPLGAKITVRKNILALLSRLLKAVENKVPERSFVENGFSFGIKEYIDIGGTKYDPKIGMIGLDVCVSLIRPGFRVKKRKLKSGKIGASHRISGAQAKEWAMKELNITMREEDHEKTFY